MEQKIQSPCRPPASEEPTHEIPDLAALTRGMTRGDEMAWRAFYDAYFGRLWCYLLVVAAGNEDAAMEALQVALIRVARHIKTFEDENVFWSWLTVLARSSFVDETRKRRRYLSFLDRFAGRAKVESGAAEPDRAEGRLSTLLERQLALLPADERKLIEQKYFERRSVREIAAAMETTEKAVESRLSRIRQKLKDAALLELRNESKI